MAYWIRNKEGNIRKVSDLTEWAKWYEGCDSRIIGQVYFGTMYTVPEEKKVSTVFLSIDHNYGEGEPVLYETMVFGVGDDEKPRYALPEHDLILNEDYLHTNRYHTEAEARRGHLLHVYAWGGQVLFNREAKRIIKQYNDKELEQWVRQLKVLS